MFYKFISESSFRIQNKFNTKILSFYFNCNVELVQNSVAQLVPFNTAAYNLFLCYRFYLYSYIRTIRILIK